jgi:hypothetical protein
VRKADALGHLAARDFPGNRQDLLDGSGHRAQDEHGDQDADEHGDGGEADGRRPPLEIAVHPRSEHLVLFVQDDAPEFGVRPDGALRQPRIFVRIRVGHLLPDDPVHRQVHERVHVLGDGEQGGHGCRSQLLILVEVGRLVDRGLDVHLECVGRGAEQSDLPGEVFALLECDGLAREDLGHLVAHPARSIDDARFLEEQDIHQVVSVEVGIEDELRAVAHVRDERSKVRHELRVCLLVELGVRYLEDLVPAGADRGRAGRGTIPHREVLHAGQELLRQAKVDLFELLQFEGDATLHSRELELRGGIAGVPLSRERLVGEHRLEQRTRGPQVLVAVELPAREVDLVVLFVEEVVHREGEGRRENQPDQRDFLPNPKATKETIQEIREHTRPPYERLSTAIIAPRLRARARRGPSRG